MNEDNNHPLTKAVAEEILTRLEVVALKPKRILAMACDGLQVRYPYAEIVSSTHEEDSVDLIVSNLCLQVENQLPEWRRILRPNGLLMFTSLGPSTLSEMDHKQHFIDMHLIGDALLQAGFAYPVMDVEHFEVNYKNKTQVLNDLEKIGITEMNHSGLSLTYEIIYGHAWCPEKKDNFLADSDGLVSIPLSALRARLRQ